MRKLFARVSLVALCLLSSDSFGQTHKAVTPRLPVAVDGSFFRALGTTPKHTSSNKMSAAANAATTQAPLKIVSIPNFSSSFTFQGTVFPFTMLGHKPQAGGTKDGPTFLCD